MLRSTPLSQNEALLRHQLLPSQPRVVALLANELRKPVLSLRILTQLFSADPVLAARLLAAANQLDFLGHRQVHSIPQALMVLETEQLRQLLVRAVPAGNFRVAEGWSISSWGRYCQQVANIARALASSVQANTAQAYTLGLLNGLGQLLLRVADPLSATELAKLLDPVHPGRVRVEMKLLGYCAGTALAGLSRNLCFPDAICASFQYQHAPFEQPAFDPLTGILHLATWRAATKHLQWTDRQLAVSFPAEVGLALGIDIDMVLRQASIDWHACGSLDLRV